MNVAVFCSAAQRLPQSWTDAARRLGTWIGTHNSTLIYGGVDAGLMADVARTCATAGGRVVGVVPSRRDPMASNFNDIKIPAVDLNDRKSIMQILADVYIVLPGGYGTLDELIGTFARLNFNDCHDKPILVFNPDRLFDPTIAQLQRMIDLGLMHPDKMQVLHFHQHFTSLLSDLEKHYLQISKK